MRLVDRCIDYVTNRVLDRMAERNKGKVNNVIHVGGHNHPGVNKLINQQLRATEANR